MTTSPARSTPTSKGKGSSTGRASLSADLLADLSAPGALPTTTAPEAAATPPTRRTGGTPALSVTVTPLRWRPPSLQVPERGNGVAVRVGPLRFEIAFSSAVRHVGPCTDGSKGLRQMARIPVRSRHDGPSSAPRTGR